MKNDVNETNLEIIREGLSYKEELELVAKRFGMTEEQTLKNIIHEVYTDGVTLIGLKTAIVLVGDYEEESSYVECYYNADGNLVVDEEVNDSYDKIEVFECETPF